MSIRQFQSELSACIIGNCNVIRLHIVLLIAVAVVALNYSIDVRYIHVVF